MAQVSIFSCGGQYYGGINKWPSDWLTPCSKTVGTSKDAKVEMGKTIVAPEALKDKNKEAQNASKKEKEAQKEKASTKEKEARKKNFL